MYVLRDLQSHLEAFAPTYLAESWDKVGLMVGSMNQQVDKVLCALDVTDDVIQEAIDGGYQCIVTHHPFLFKPLATLNFDAPLGKRIQKLVIHQIAVYSMHTNFDITWGGTNDWLFDKLGFKNKNILMPTLTQKFNKLVVYVPESHFEVVRQQIIAFDKEHIGNYKGCTFSTEGEGTFVPLEGSNPFIGEQNKLEKVKERKIECLVGKEHTDEMIAKIKEVHPYEEVAYDVYPLDNLSKQYGLGRAGTMEPCTVRVLVEKIKAVLGLDTVRVVGDCDTIVSKVSICSGSGASFLKQAAKVSQVYLTGDMKFHEAQEAKDLGLIVIDLGHYGSENATMEAVKDYMNGVLPELEVSLSKVSGEVFATL